MCDLMWSDPEDDEEGWMLNPRGAGWVIFLHSTYDQYQQVLTVNPTIWLGASDLTLGLGLTYPMNLRAKGCSESGYRDLSI